jgi:hypothetical protein
VANDKTNAPELVTGGGEFRNTGLLPQRGICTGETYKSAVKLTFFKGAALSDPSGHFNSSLDAKVRRAIGIKEGDEIDEGVLKNLIREAVELSRKS